MPGLPMLTRYSKETMQRNSKETVPETFIVKTHVNVVNLTTTSLNV